MDAYTVYQVPEAELGQWTTLVEESPQGTLFETTLWGTVIEPVFGLSCRYYVCLKGSELVAGCPVWTDASGRPRLPPFTPFTGIMVRNQPTVGFAKRLHLMHAAIECLADHLAQEFEEVSLIHHTTLIDIRPLLWKGWMSQVRYTCYADLHDLDALWKHIDQRYDVKKARTRGIQVREAVDADAFYALYVQTFARQEKDTPIDRERFHLFYTRLHAERMATTYAAVTETGEWAAAAVILRDAQRAYYLLGASHPALRTTGAASLVLWTALERSAAVVQEFDFVGANTQSIAKFKEDFATRLEPYYVTSSTSPRRGAGRVAGQLVAAWRRWRAR